MGLLLFGLAAGSTLHGQANAPRAYIASNRCIQTYGTNGVLQEAWSPFSYPTSVAVSPDNQVVYVAGMYEGDVVVFDAQTLQQLGSIPNTTMTSEIAFLPDGSAAYFALWTGPYPGVKIVDPVTRSVVKYMPEVVGTPYGIVSASDGRHVYVAQGWGWVGIINTATRILEDMVWLEPPGYFPPYSGYPSFSLGVTPDGGHVYVPMQDAQLYVVDTASRSLVDRIPLGPPGAWDGYRTDDVAISPDGQRVYVSRMYQDRVTVVDAGRNTVIGNITGLPGPFGIAMTGDGQYAFVATRYGGVYLIDTASHMARPLGSGGCSEHLAVAAPPSLSGNTPPVASCQDTTVSAGPACTAPGSIDNGSSDPDGDPITLDQSPAGPYGLGTTPVLLTVTDDHAASATCTANVTVHDGTAPTLTVPATITVDATGPAGATIPEATLGAAAADNCTVVVITRTPAGNQFSIGVTAVTYSAHDPTGNQSMAMQTVTVLGPSHQVANLTGVVNGSTVDQGVKNSLLSKLDNALASMGRGNSPAACNQVAAFINEVTAQAGKKIPFAQAQDWLAAAIRVRAALGC
jgi:YVTN family beta-propeller protein